MLVPVSLELITPPDIDPPHEVLLADLRRAVLEVRRFGAVVPSAAQVVRVTIEREETRHGTGWLITVQHLEGGSVEQEYRCWCPRDSVQMVLLKEAYLLADPAVYPKVVQGKGPQYNPKHPQDPFLLRFNEALASLAEPREDFSPLEHPREVSAILQACEECQLAGDLEAAARSLTASSCPVAEQRLLGMRMLGLLAARRLGDDLPRLLLLMGRCRSLDPDERLVGGLSSGDAHLILHHALRTYGLAPSTQEPDLRSTIQAAFGVSYLKLVRLGYELDPALSPEAPPRELVDRAAEAFPWARWGTLVRAQEDDGMEILERALQIEPDFTEAHFHRVMRLLASRTNREEAREQVERLLELAPDFSPALRVAAALLSDHPDSSARALELIQRALELNPWDHVAFTLRGNILHKQGRSQEAVRDLERALELESSSQIWYSRGCVYLETDQFESALKDFDRATDAYPEFSQAWVNMGVCYRRLNQPDQALIVLSRAMLLDPQLTNAPFHRGMIYAEQGRRHQALADLDHVVQNLPAHNPMAIDASRMLRKMR